MSSTPSTPSQSSIIADVTPKPAGPVFPRLSQSNDEVPSSPTTPVLPATPVMPPHLHSHSHSSSATPAPAAFPKAAAGVRLYESSPGVGIGIGAQPAGSPADALEPGSAAGSWAAAGSLDSAALRPDPAAADDTDAPDTDSSGSTVARRFAAPVAKAITQKIACVDGVTVHDDYYWFREKSNPKVLKYLEEENAYAEAVMADTAELQDALYEECAKRSTGVQRSVMQPIDDWLYYTRHEDEKQYAVHCRKLERDRDGALPDAEGDEHVILDENEEAEGEDYFALGAFEVSFDHNWLLYGVDTEGHEQFSMYVRNLSTGAYLDDELCNTSWTARWAADNRTILYTRVDGTGRSHQLLRHVLGENATDASDDEVVYDEPDERFVLRITHSNSRRFFLLNVDGQLTKEVMYLRADQPRGTFRSVAGRQRGVRYEVSHHGQYFYIMTNEGGAKNFKVVKAPLDAPDARDQWEEVLPHRDDVLLERVDLFRHHMVAWEWHNALQRVRITDLSDGEVHYLQFSEALYALWPGEAYDTEDTLPLQYFNTNTFQFSYSSLVQPTIVYDYDMDNHRKKKRKEQQVAGFIKEEYHQKRIHATAPDGSLVPISLVYKISLKNSTGNPLLLMAYGAYGGHYLPTFSAERLSLLDRGVIVAMAHVRGDASCGTEWYEQGKFLHKKNTFTDFIACAEHLIAEGYTTPDKLAIYGRSAGGLLIGAVANMAPQLFKAAILKVPFVDVIGSMLDASVPWTAYEWDEWGDPREPAFFHYMLSYSPYANVDARPYPHMLVTTGLNDPRVCYWEPAKYVARMRRLRTNNTALLLKTYLTGHMGASGRFDALSEMCFDYAFVIDRLGLLPSVASQKPLLKVISTVSIAPPDLLAMFQGYQVTMVLCAALELGVFNFLHKQPNFGATPAGIARGLGLAADSGLVRLLQALSAVGILLKEGDQYALTDVAASHLVEGMPGFIGELRFTLANELLWKATRDLPAAIRRGGPVHEVPQRALSESMAANSTSAARHVALALQQALSLSDTRKKSLTVLDLCCGNGVVGYTLAKTQRLSKHVRVWSFDTPQALKVARQAARDMGITDRVEFIEGDVMAAPLAELDLGGPYDLVLVGQNVLSGCDTEHAAELLERVSDALKSTGRVVLNETVAGGDLTAYSQLYSVALFATRREGRIHSLQWYKQVLARAGFAPPTVQDLRPFPEKLLITSRNIISRHAPRAKPSGYE